MSIPSVKTGARSLVPQRARRMFAVLRQEIVGVAQDFWKDGNRQAAPPQTRKRKSAYADEAMEMEPAPLAFSEDFPTEITKTEDGLWHAAPGEISEKMWGNGTVSPCDEYVTELMVAPMGLTKEKSLLDLSAGLGGRMRKIVNAFGLYVNGREPDPEIAARGMALSVAAGRGKRAEIAPYDPMNLIEERSYDCVIGRETIYRVADKEKFIKSIVACCKPEAQISFTDYIVNPEVHTAPAILAWRAYEKGANPAGLVEMAEIWAKAGISLRVHDDQTDYYKQEVKKGLLRFAGFMASGIKPDAPTKKAIEKRITTWAHRMAAIEQGMKFYRFYGLR